MLTRKKIDFAVKVNDPLRFVVLGNLFPNTESIDYFISQFTSEVIYLLREAYSINLKYLFYNYISNVKYKTLSTYVTNLIDVYGINKLSDGSYTMSDVGFSECCKHISYTYYEKWDRLWNTFNQKYDMIKPYDMSINDSYNEQHNGTTNTSSSGSYTSQDITASKVTNDTTENDVYGFNSTTAVPSDISKNTYDSQDTNTNNNNSERSQIVSHGRGLESDRSVSRIGNIGNIPQQDLIQKERDLQMYLIWDTIYDDLDRVLTRSKYII